MPLAPHQRELLDCCPGLDPRDIPENWNGAADLDEKLHLNKQARLAQKAAVKTKPALIRQPGTVSRKELKSVVEEMAKAIVKLERQVAELEGEKMKFVGVWKRGQAYSKGSFATHQGSGWHCNADTVAEPGTSRDWTLSIKRGRDGKDAKPAARKMIHALA